MMPAIAIARHYLPEAGAAEFLAEICAVEANDAAHLVQARSHALADAVAQSFSSVGGSHGRKRSGHPGGRLVVEIRRDDRCAIVVVPGVQDKANRVPNPLRRFDRAEFVENENVRLEYWPENVQFRGLDRRVIGILNLLQQLAIVVKQAGNAAIKNQFLDDSNG